MSPKRNSSPVSDSLLENIRAFIADSAPGRRLPSEHSLVAKYNVSRKTVGRVLNQLENEGALIRKRGSGSYVAGQPVFTLMLPTPEYLSNPSAWVPRLLMKGAIRAASEKNMAFQTIAVSPSNDSAQLDLSCLTRINRFSKIFVSTWFSNLFELLAKRDCQVAYLHSQDICYGFHQYTRNWILLELNRMAFLERLLDRLYQEGKRRIALTGGYLLSERKHPYILAYRKKIAEFGLPELVLEIDPEKPFPFEAEKKFYRESRYDALLFSVVSSRHYESVQQMFSCPPETPAIGLVMNPEQLNCDVLPECYLPDYEKIGYEAVIRLADYDRFHGKTYLYDYSRVSKKTEEGTVSSWEN